MKKRTLMARVKITSICAGMFAAVVGNAVSVQAQQPTFATNKVEGTDNVYIFRYQGHQSMFVVTPAGVIATDPIGLGRPQAVTTYIDEIKKVTTAPIKYVIYSHHHWDHIAGGKPFKDLGSIFVAHRNAKARLEAVKNPDVVMPTVWVDKQMNIRLANTTLELNYVGRNHSDNSLVMRLPKEKIIYAVDFIPLTGVPFRDMMDNWPLELEESIKKVLAMDWDRLIPGHPGAGGRQIGTKDDARADLSYLEDLSAEVKKAAAEGKCYDTAMKEIKLPKYESFVGYGPFLAGNIERYCELWRRGI
jgi:glyoxylase-like metal-dependent hydrolase (beta-lactamase superfamily II)